MIDLISIVQQFLQSAPTIYFWYVAIGVVIILLNDLTFIPLALLHDRLLGRYRKHEVSPLVTVLVPAHNEQEDIASLLHTLFEQSYKNMEILVINDGSTDNTRAILEPYAFQGRIRLLNLGPPNAGKHAALNAGIKLAKGEILMVVDADGLLERDAVANMVLPFRDPNVMSVSGNIRVANPVNLLTKCQSLEYIRDINIPRRAFDLLNIALVVPGPLGAFRRSVMLEIGQYDPDTVTEDFDLTVKVQKARNGRQIASRNITNAVAYTEAPERLRDLIRQRKRWYGGMAQTYAKHRRYRMWSSSGSYSMIGVPYLFYTLFIVPILELIMTGITIIGLVFDPLGIMAIFIVFSAMETLTSILAVTLDRADWRLVLLSPLYVIGYRQLLDLIRIYSYVQAMRGKLGWERAQRFGETSAKARAVLSVPATIRSSLSSSDSSKKRERAEAPILRENRVTKRDLDTERLAIISLVVISTLLFSLAGYVNQVQLYDDKAYLNNALIHSGRLDKKDVLGPYADERPPLFWWLLTTIFLLDAPVLYAKFLSPFFGVVLVVVTYMLTKRMFKSVRQGFYSGLFLALNAFVLSGAGTLLSDIAGAALSALSLLCLYFGVVERKYSYLLVCGPFLALSLMMRDQNLILFPVVIFYLVTKLNLKSYAKTSVAFLSSLSLGVPILLYGLIGTLVVLSNWLTPILIGRSYPLPSTSVGLAPALLFSLIVLFMTTVFCYFDTNPGRKKAYILILGSLLFFVTVYPYLWDNYLLGTEYEIEGKGIFSRLISHQIMSETIGVGAGLTAMARRVWWLSHLPLLVSPPIILFSTIGLIVMIRKRMYSQLALLFPWLAFTSGFTIFFNYLEMRFLIPALPVIAIIASKGLVEATDWVKSRLPSFGSTAGRICMWQRLGTALEVALVLLAALIADIVSTGIDLPARIGSLAIPELFSKAVSTPNGWFSDYLVYLEGKLASPSLRLDPVYILESIACFIIVILFAFTDSGPAEEPSPILPLIPTPTEKNVLNLLSDGTTLQQLTERMSRELSTEFSSRSVGDILLHLQRRGCVCLEQGRWWRTSEGVDLLKKLLEEEVSEQETRSTKSRLKPLLTHLRRD